MDLLARNAEFYKQRVSHDYTPDPAVLARLQRYDPKAYVQWDCVSQRWGLWRKTERGEIFSKMLGPEFNNATVRKIIGVMDTRNKAWSDEIVDAAIKEATTKREESPQMKEIDEQAYHAVTADSHDVCMNRVEHLAKAIGGGE